MTATEAILALERARDELAEGVRYVTINPRAALDYVAYARREIEDLFAAHHKVDINMVLCLGRIKENLRVSAWYVQVDPDLLSGYIHGARFELGVLLARLRERAGVAA